MSFSATDIAHGFMKEFVRPGDLCIDATAGRGGDTLFLCGLTGMSGSVLAFDIQQEAVLSTRERIEQAGFGDICTVICDSHANMDKYTDGGAACVCFNLGWLPGGDHSIFTHADSTIEAINKGLSLLKDGGVMSICIYYGGRSGFDERDRLLEFLPTLDSTRYTVIINSFANRTGCQPIPVMIFKGIV